MCTAVSVNLYVAYLQRGRWHKYQIWQKRARQNDVYLRVCVCVYVSDWEALLGLIMIFVEFWKEKNDDLFGFGSNNGLDSAGLSSHIKRLSPSAYMVRLLKCRLRFLGLWENVCNRWGRDTGDTTCDVHRTPWLKFITRSPLSWKLNES